MIAYEIIVNHQRDQKSTRQIVKPGDANFKEVVFQRNHKQCQYAADQRVKLRNGHTRGTITEIISDINQIQWQNNKPLFVRVKFDNGQEIIVNHNQLKRSKK